MSEYFMNKSNSNAQTKNGIKNHKEYEKNEWKERKRNILYLIRNYLKEQNLYETADVLNNEAQLTNQYEICDNVDLDIIYQDYESYYTAKFNKKPKVLKKIINVDMKLNDSHNVKRKSKGGINTSSNLINTQTKVQEIKLTNEQINYYQPPEFQIDITSLSNTKQDEKKSSDINSTKGTFTTVLNSSDVYTTKPLCDFDGYSIEWREIAEQIVKEIVPKSLGVKWSDCIGLDQPKEILKEATIYPFVYPELFNDLITPWKGVLLYGPPGTGKTLLAKALACETETTFINLTNSSFISKWRGESEKMIKVLFDIAKYYAPTTIFIDEIDSIAYRHDDTHHDASRRFKSELLTQLDGLLSSDQQILVLAATNTPWDLDTAILRRFEKRIYLDLPTVSNRSELFKYFLAQAGFHFNNNDYMAMAGATELFSGSDIRLITKEVCMNLFRKKLIQINKTGDHKNLIPNEIPTMSEVLETCKKINPVMNVDVLKRYKVWTESYANT